MGAGKYSGEGQEECAAMTTTPKLGITVYTESRTGGPPPPGTWWDLKSIIGHGLGAVEGDTDLYVKKVLDLRMRTKDHAAAVKWLEEVSKDESAQDKFFSAYFVDLSVPHVNGNNLPAYASAGKVDDLGKLARSKGSFEDAYTSAVGCTKDGCKAYQKAILQLLGNRDDVKLNLYKAAKAERQKYGLDVMPEKIKFLTRFTQAQKKPQIDVIFGSDNYRNKFTCARHTEILSGILFEAGNVYSGNYGGGDRDPTQAQETAVFVHNARQVAGIARQHPVTQNDWRNLMTLILATDTDLKTFKCTKMAVDAFTGSVHDLSSGLKVAY
jgi:hypothetical protein